MKKVSEYVIIDARASSELWVGIGWLDFVDGVWMR